MGPIPKHPVGSQQGLTLPLLGLPKHKTSPRAKPLAQFGSNSLYPQCPNLLCAMGVWLAAHPRRRTIPLGQPLLLRKYPSPTTPGWPWEPSPHHSTQMCFIISCSSSEEQSRAHSTLCRQEAREKVRYVLVGVSRAGAWCALLDPGASPTRYRRHTLCPRSCTPSSFLGAAGLTSIKLRRWPVDFIC